jgi:hypothetical protein
MDVFGHEDIAVNVEGVLFPSRFEDGFKQGLGFWGIEVRETALTTEGEEVKVSGGLMAVQTGWHGFLVREKCNPMVDAMKLRRTWGTRIE